MLDAALMLRHAAMFFYDDDFLIDRHITPMARLLTLPCRLHADDCRYAAATTILFRLCRQRDAATFYGY